MSQFVNGHTGNQRLRQLAVARKSQFDEGTYTEKRALATEIVSIIKDLTPPGRFLRKAKPTKPLNWPVETIPSVADESEWQEELDLERCIHKACQVMRDIDRQDRKDRDERRRLKKLNTEGKVSVEYHINSSDGNRNDGTAAMPDTAATSDAEKAVHEDNNDSEVADKTNPIAAFEAHEATATGPDIPV